jgi:CRP-like cAMP-binding protein
MSDFFSYTGASTAPAAAGAAPVSRAILADLSSADWEQFIAYAARRRYPAGAVIVQIGDTAPALHFIASGQVDLTPAQGPSTRRGEGEAFGLLSFLDGAPSGVTATAGRSGPTELLRLTPETLQQLAAWQPRIALALLRDLGAHVAARLRRLQAGD